MGKLLWQAGTGRRDVDCVLRAEIKARSRQHASPRHVAAIILDVWENPPIRSGEITVLDVVGNQPVRALGVLATPNFLKSFSSRPELAY